MSYNGYNNYETWIIALWIDNDEGLLDQIIELTRGACDENDLSNTIEEFIMDPENGIIPELPTGPASDLLNAAISEVDWFELAELYWKEYAYTDDDGETNEED
jgi:hypothetical protein